MIEEIEEEKDNALMSIENKKKKTDIATLKQGIQEGDSEADSELKQGIQEGEAEAEAAVSKEESAITSNSIQKEEAEAEASSIKRRRFSNYKQ